MLSVNLAVGLIWLFHISGIIGSFAGFEEWFLAKTPLNLLACFILLLAVGPIKDARNVFVIYVFFAAGILVEWVGISYGVPFGEYYYGDNLGAKMAGVPILIGINWAMLVLITGSIATRAVKSRFLRVALGAGLMVFLDLFIEPNASSFDFWYWAGDHIPVSNYIAWYVIAFVLHWIFQMQIKKLNFKFSLNLYLAQLVFFVSFYVYSQI